MTGHICLEVSQPTGVEQLCLSKCATYSVTGRPCVYRSAWSTSPYARRLRQDGRRKSSTNVQQERSLSCGLRNTPTTLAGRRASSGYRAGSWTPCQLITNTLQLDALKCCSKPPGGHICVVPSPARAHVGAFGQAYRKRLVENQEPTFGGLRKVRFRVGRADLAVGIVVKFDPALADPLSR